MTWMDELRLRDISDGQVIEATCRKCRHSWKLTPVQLMLNSEHRDQRISEAAAALRCRRFGCGNIGARLTVLRDDDLSSFVSGMP